MMRETGTPDVVAPKMTLETIAKEKYLTDENLKKQQRHEERMLAAKKELPKGESFFVEFFGMQPDKAYVSDDGACRFEKDGTRLLWAPGFQQVFPDNVYRKGHFEYNPICEICGEALLYSNSDIRSMAKLGEMLLLLNPYHKTCKTFAERARKSSWIQKVTAFITVGRE